MTDQAAVASVVFLVAFFVFLLPFQFAFVNRLMLRHQRKTACYRFAYLGPPVAGFAPLRPTFLLPVLTCSGS